MDSCFNRVKREALTFFQRCEGSFSSENERIIDHTVLVQRIRIVGVEKAFQGAESFLRS